MMFTNIIAVRRAGEQLNNAAVACQVSQNACETLQTVQQKHQQLERFHVSPEVYYR